MGLDLQQKKGSVASRATERRGLVLSHDIELIVIPLGVAGTVYKSAKKSLHQHLGVTGPALDTESRNL
jgi:hypothetical protein